MLTLSPQDVTDAAFKTELRREKTAEIWQKNRNGGGSTAAQSAATARKHKHTLCSSVTAPNRSHTTLAGPTDEYYQAFVRHHSLKSMLK